MRRTEFLEKLRQDMKHISSSELEAVIVEYDDHFSAGVERGKTEAEIAISLGNPSVIARAFLLENEIPLTPGGEFHPQVLTARRQFHIALRFYSVNFFNAVIFAPLSFLTLIALTVLLIMMLSVLIISCTAIAASPFSYEFFESLGLYLHSYSKLAVFCYSMSVILFSVCGIWTIIQVIRGAINKLITYALVDTHRFSQKQHTQNEAH